MHCEAAWAVQGCTLLHSCRGWRAVVAARGASFSLSSMGVEGSGSGTAVAHFIPFWFRFVFCFLSLRVFSFFVFITGEPLKWRV